MWRQWLPLAALTVAVGACDPYTRFVGQESAGALDPTNFLPGYLGVGSSSGPTAPANPNQPGNAKMIPSYANLDSSGNPTVGYFAFPFTGADLTVMIPGNTTDNADTYTAPVEYSFDEDLTTLIETPGCIAPKNYVYDQQRDDVRYDTQGYIFTDIPDSTIDPAYQPVVAEVSVASNGPGGTLKCQSTKEEIDLVKRKDVTFSKGLAPPSAPSVPGAHDSGVPNGIVYARPVIDPSIDVRYPPGFAEAPAGGLNQFGLGPQQWGWYGRFLLAWLDGGPIPAKQTTVTDQEGNTQVSTVMEIAFVYYPTMHPGEDANGNTIAVTGALGDGFDVILQRGTAGSSPLCEVISFDPADPMNPETTVGAINMATAVDTGEAIWCIQVNQ